MCKMSTGVVALFIASLVGCGSQPALTSGEGSGGNAGRASGGQAGSTFGSGTAGGFGGVTGAGGVGAGETGGVSTAGASGSTGGTGTCSRIDCGVPACAGEFQPNPDPCGCAVICVPTPDAGLAKDAGSADTTPTCVPVACPAIACVGGTHPNPDPCGCPLCSPAPDAGVAKDAGPPTACPMLASLNSTDAAAVSWGAGRMWLECKYTDGTTEGCISNDATGCPGPVVTGDGDLVGCSDRCAANEYGLSYGGVGPSAPPPSIDLPAGCGPGMYTPGGLGFYCCPCGM
jgi:hypothetical protein